MSRNSTVSSLPVLNVPNNSNVVKVAVKLSEWIGNQYEMFPLYTEMKLENTVNELCSTWKLTNPEHFQLQFDGERMKPPPIYITEQNRDKINNGDVLKLDYTPHHTAQTIIDGFPAISENLLQRLEFFARDKLFADEFFKLDGLSKLTHFIQDVPKSGSLSKQYAIALKAIVTLMEHGVVNWSDLDPAFLRSVMVCLEERPRSETAAEVISQVTRCALSIMELSISSSDDGQALVKEVKLDIKTFFHTLKIQSQDIQSKCISLVNKMMEICDEETRKMIRNYLYSPENRTLIKDKIFTLPIQPDMAYQLYALQTHLFSLLKDRLNGAINSKDEAANKEIQDLWKLAFDQEVDAKERSKLNTDTKDFSKLGFKDAREPLHDFGEVPPGALALDCISFFARTYGQNYVQVVLENSRERADDQDCPFVQASVQLTKMLAELLRIGEDPSEPDDLNDQTHYPMFFTKEKPFEEFFCVCIQRFTKTWKEMKASVSDFNKVLMVVKEQILRALKDKPHTFDSLKNKLNQWSFAKIQEARQKDIDAREERKILSKPIRELRELLEPEILDVIKQQRLNRMIAGHTFKYRKAGRKETYCRLSHNAKVLQYGTTVEQSSTNVLHTINILDIIEVKEENKRNEKSIIIMGQDKELLTLNTTDVIHDIWMDGLNALTGKAMSSEKARTDLDELLSMEVKLRLLDAEGLNFPEEPPTIPPPPPNYDFVTA